MPSSPGAIVVPRITPVLGGSDPAHPFRSSIVKGEPAAARVVLECWMIDAGRAPVGDETSPYCASVSAVSPVESNRRTVIVAPLPDAVLDTSWMF
eukprot:gene20254-47435_t